MSDPLDAIAETIAGAAPMKVPGGTTVQDETAASAGPRDLGYDLTAMNSEWCVVMVGMKTVIFHMQPDGPVEDRLRMVSIESLRAWFSNCFTEIADPSGRVKRITWAARWLQERGRRQYKGVEFWPNPDGQPGTRGYLNLWQGFSVAPKAKPKGYDTFRVSNRFQERPPFRSECRPLVGRSGAYPRGCIRGPGRSLCAHVDKVWR